MEICENLSSLKIVLLDAYDISMVDLIAHHRSVSGYTKHQTLSLGVAHALHTHTHHIINHISPSLEITV